MHSLEFPLQILNFNSFFVQNYLIVFLEIHFSPWMRCSKVRKLYSWALPQRMKHKTRIEEITIWWCRKKYLERSRWIQQRTQVAGWLNLSLLGILQRWEWKLFCPGSCKSCVWKLTSTSVSQRRHKQLTTFYHLGLTKKSVKGYYVWPTTFATTSTPVVLLAGGQEGTTSLFTAISLKVSFVSLIPSL